MKMVDKNQLEKLFRKHCKNCGAYCCKTKEITVFKFELDNIKKIGWDNIYFLKQGRKKNNHSSFIKRIPLKNGCPFVTENGCIFNPSFRPTDCLSYPVYPIIKYGKDSSTIKYMLVHKSCPKYKAIAEDLKLIKYLYGFWNKIINNVQPSHLKEWFGDKKNYWLDKNLVKIKIL